MIFPGFIYRIFFISQIVYCSQMSSDIWGKKKEMFFSFKVVIWQWNGNEWERVPEFCCFHQLCCFADGQVGSAWGWAFRLQASPINCLFWLPFLTSVYFIKCPSFDYVSIFCLYNNGITFYCVTSNSLWILFLSDILGKLGDGLSVRALRQAEPLPQGRMKRTWAKAGGSTCTALKEVKAELCRSPSREPLPN